MRHNLRTKSTSARSGCHAYTFAGSENASAGGKPIPTHEPHDDEWTESKKVSGKI